jgi:hypothetical protein
VIERGVDEGWTPNRGAGAADEIRVGTGVIAIDPPEPRVVLEVDVIATELKARPDRRFLGTALGVATEGDHPGGPAIED